MESVGGLGRGGAPWGRDFLEEKERKGLVGVEEGGVIMSPAWLRKTELTEEGPPELVGSLGEDTGGQGAGEDRASLSPFLLALTPALSLPSWALEGDMPRLPRWGTARDASPGGQPALWSSRWWGRHRVTRQRAAGAPALKTEAASLLPGGALQRGYRPPFLLIN